MIQFLVTMGRERESKGQDPYFYHGIIDIIILDVVLKINFILIDIQEQYEVLTDTTTIRSLFTRR